MSVTVFAFYLFAVSALTGGLFTVISRNPVHSVLWLILSFLSLGGVVCLVGGRICRHAADHRLCGRGRGVVLVFVVMMLDVDFAELRAEMAKYLPLALLIGVVLLMQFSVAIGVWDV